VLAPRRHPLAERSELALRDVLVAIPLRDAACATIALVGHVDGRNPLVGTLRAFALERTGV